MNQYAPETFCWVELGVKDPDRAKAFYSRLFGWTPQDVPAGPDMVYTMLQLRGLDVAALYRLNSEQLRQGVPPHWGSYVSVESVDASAARAKELGAIVLVEPFDVMDVGRMTVLRDPTGAVVSLWQARKHIGARLVNEPNTFCWNELLTHDTRQASAFYTALFGWTAQEQQMGPILYTVFMNGDRAAAGMMAIAKEWGAVPPNWLVYFAVDDCDAAAGQIGSLGGHVLAPPQDAAGVGRFAVAEDSEGAAFGVIKLAQA